MSPRLIALVALAAAVAVSGCGKRGTLERPPPLWGHHADKAQAKADEAAGRDSGAQRTGPDHKTMQDPPESRNTTIAADPLDGLPADPRGGSGQPGNMNPH